MGKRWEYRTTWSASWEICMQVRKQQLELDMEQQTGSNQGKEYVKGVYCHSAYLTYLQSTSCKMPDWMKHKLESRFPGEISITSDRTFYNRHFLAFLHLTGDLPSDCVSNILFSFNLEVTCSSLLLLFITFFCFKQFICWRIEPHTTPPRSAAARYPIPTAGHCWPMPLQETLKHSKGGLAQFLWGHWVLVHTHKTLCALGPRKLCKLYG